VDSVSGAPRPRDIIVLGSTGSIGTQAADIIARNRDRFAVSGLAAGGGNPGLLARQAIELDAGVVAVADPGAVPELRAALAAIASADGGRGRS
jgi:1-deoxy-D-xylulose-5-phosphate reductoisomerase